MADLVPVPPSVSVIVPTYARPDRLRACLDALATLETPEAGLEVIVVDDGSPAPAETVAAPFRGRVPLRVLRQANAGPAAARNAGAAEASGDLLAFTDDDCRPEPGWARAFAAAAEVHPGALLGGKTVNALPRNPFSSASQILMDYLGDYFAPETGRAPLVASNNLALPREAFLALGGFDEGFPLAAGEDRDLCARWHESGRPTAFVPRAVVQHAHAMGMWGFVRQHANYGRGAYRYHQLRPAGNLRPEPLAFYAGLVASPLRRSRAPRAWLHAALLGVSQVANVAGYAAERARRGEASGAAPRATPSP